MADTEPDAQQLERWARMVGAHQEALRVHASRIGTEHLLMATFADPEVRRRLGEVGVDMRDVQHRVGSPAALTGTVVPRHATPSVIPLSESATRVLDALLTAVAEDPLLAGRVDPARDRNPRVMSRLLRCLAVGLLRDPGPGTARTILADLTGGRSSPASGRGATLIAELLGDVRDTAPGLGVPLSRPEHG